jgi:hypothetical protein
MEKVRVLLVLAAVFLIAACTTTPEATPARDAEAKRFEPVTRDSVIYIYRPDSWPSGGITNLTADDRIIGASLPGTFFRIIVLPGRTVLDTHAPDQGRIEVETHGNDVVFIEMRTSGGAEGPPSTRFRRMPPEIAKAEILRCCSMLETWRPGQPRLVW